MTFTDAELDKLDEKLSSQIGDDVSVIFNHEYLFKQSRAAITYLRQRASLAEAIIANSGITHFDQQPQRDPIGAKIMRERAAEHIRTLHTVTLMTPDQNAALQIAANGIDRCPIPTHAEILAYALELPEVKALVEAARPYAATVSNADFGRQMREYDALVAALAALEPKP